MSSTKKPLRSGITLLNGKPAPMERTGALQDIQPERYPHLQPPPTAGDLYMLRLKQMREGVQFDRATPKRICAASTPTYTKPMYPMPPHVTPERIAASMHPRREGDRLCYPDGRVTDLAGNPWNGQK